MGECNQCQRIKNRAEIPVGKLKINLVPEKSQQYILVDFIMKLPVSSDYDSILVVCDRFLKILHFVAMTEKITAEGLANLFRDNVQKLHGLPESVILNRRPQFAAELMKELNKAINGFSFTNRWTNREDKPRAGTVFKNIY